MPAISKIRFTNVIYDNKQKRFNDDIFIFDGRNGAVLLENGGGKTVFIQAAIQAVIPHADLGERKIKETLLLDNTCAHIAIEWILKDKPRKYCVTAVSLYKDTNGGVQSYRFINEYSAGSGDAIELIPFAVESSDGRKRPASKEEISEYYSRAKAASMLARTFGTIHEYQSALSKDYGIIGSEWRSQLAINKKEGGVEEFFDGCPTTGHLVDNLLIPSIEAVIAGDGEKGFAKTFEMQRDTFKEYNRLTRLIKESNIAEEMLNVYVGKYERLHSAQQTMLEIQRRAKALWVFAGEEKAELVKHCGQLNAQGEALGKERRELLHKQNSMVVYESESQLNAAKNEYENAKAVLEKKREMYNEKARRIENIELHKARQDVLSLEAKILSVKEEIENLEKDTDTEELYESFERCAGQLKGCYLGLEDGIGKQLDYAKIQLGKLEAGISSLKAKIESKQGEASRHNKNKASLEGAYTANEDRISSLRQKILSDAKNERVEDALSNFNKRLKEIQRAQAELTSKINDMDIRTKELKAQQPVIRGKQEKAREQLTTVTTRLNDIDDNVRELSALLGAGYKEFYNISPQNFYSKERLIKENFTVLLDGARKAKEEAFTNERLKKRLSDGYNENNYFTGTPELYQSLEDIKNKFKFIQAGGQYVNQAAESLGLSAEEILSRFPFWHYAVVVNESDADRLKAELSAREQTGPVLILTLAKAKAFAEGRSLDAETVAPEFWISNLDGEGFNAWKTRVKNQGAAAEDARRQAEQRLLRIQEDAGKVDNFFLASPHEGYLQMSLQRTELEGLLGELTEQDRGLQKELDAIEASRREAVDKTKELTTEEAYVSRNREYAQSILKMEEENKARGKEIMEIDEALAKVTGEIGSLQRDLEYEQESAQQQRDDKNNFSYQLNSLREEKWYKAVADKKIEIGDGTPKNVLIDNYEKIQSKLLQVSEGRRELEATLAGHSSNLNRAKLFFRSLKEKARYPWDEASEYYEGMSLELDSLKELASRLKQETENERNKTEKLSASATRKEGAYLECLRIFKTNYSELYVFEKSISEAKAMLQEEEQSIGSKSEALEKAIKLAEDTRKNAEEAIAILASMDREFKFIGIDIGSLQTEDALNYPYNRIKLVKSLDAELTAASNYVSREEAAANGAKSEYCRLCRKNISDTRNRDRLIDVAERASNYKELLENQKSMKESLESAKMIARTSLVDSENKMFQFRNHLYTHVEKIAKELLLLPKKTRIRTEDGWKEIFDIGFEPWSEQEARAALQGQIDFILGRIETEDEFKTDDGMEDLTKIRAFIEKSFRTKQLLKKILGSNEIRVKCRKVTNDNKVSGKLCSWEESEKWSGGERWSKNMALFLGIQNYIAEKTEPDLKPSKLRSCVFLDNPFGKASSEHVLSPVFFIAEALGFQIITVTAHAEGKFISDYFPIVYSLKLRESAGVKTSVITKELIIKHAYFEDKDPMALTRLLPKEQLNLFNM